MNKKLKKFSKEGGFAIHQRLGKGIHKQMKKTYDEVSGKNMRKEAELEQAKQRETIGRQKQQEQLKLAEMDSEINRRRLIRYNGGMRSLYSTLGG